MIRRRVDSRSAKYIITKSDMKEVIMTDYELSSEEYNRVWPIIRSIIEDWMEMPSEAKDMMFDEIAKTLIKEGY